MNQKPLVVISLLAGSSLLAGCPGRSTVPYPTDDGAPVEQAPGAETQGRDIDSPEMISELPRDARLLENLVVYFDYDQADIRSDFNSMLTAHGRYLAGNPTSSLRLEGHADERGSREYNIGLGERRAQAVRRVLLLQGASAAQISTVSYGEERPAQLGSNDQAYIQNRRVELVYRQ